MRLVTLLALILVLSSCAVAPQREKGKDYASFPLANCRVEMDQADYWIAKLPEPDRLILTPREIAELNQRGYKSGLLTDIFSETLWDYKFIETDRSEEINPDAVWNTPAASCPGLVGGYTLYTYLKDETERIKARVRFDLDGQAVSRDVFAALDENLNLWAIREDNPIRYGLTVRRSDFRFYPTDMHMSSEINDGDFDVIQVSAVAALQPVAILHESRDKQWLFAVSAICRGWVKRRDVAEHCGQTELRPFLDPPRVLVVTGHSVGVVDSPGDTRVAERLYLGTSVPLVERQESYYRVKLPARDPETGCLKPWTGFIPAQADVHEGYLEYTPRQVYQKAFQLLRTPYSWGGKGEHRDCSQFIMDLHAAMGIKLPRNSSAQACMGTGRTLFNGRHSLEQRRLALARLQTPALLQLPGHIMLYLGTEENNVYAIHDIWAYRVPDGGKDRKIIIGQVTVSDLTLGENSARKSLIERLTTVNCLKP